MTSDLLSRRAERARVLAERDPAAADILSFYAKLAEYQRALCDRLPEADEEQSVLAAIPGFVAWLAHEAPAALAASARAHSSTSAEEWRVWLHGAFAEEPPELPPYESAALFVVEALLQPLAERAAGGRTGPHPVAAMQGSDERRCPRCRTLPVVGLLREEGHGARRGLVCARCLLEWPAERVLCIGCGEREFDALPVYRAEQVAHVRIDACDRCRRYIKTIDLTKDGLAVPVVDDLATTSLDLWARSQGYTRLRANLLRL